MSQPSAGEPDRRPPSSSSGSFWLAPGTILATITINLVILSYAVYRAGSSHHGPSTPVHPQAAGDATIQPIAASTSAPPSTASGSLQANAPQPVLVENLVEVPDLKRVQQLYIQHCAACHGEDGRGEGPAAAQLFPKPRNFVDSPFRFASTGGPRHEVVGALERTITEGVPRSAMPGFDSVLTESEIAGLARYTLQLRENNNGHLPNGSLLNLGERPPSTAAMIGRGAALYQSLGCASCHGNMGQGDGPAARNLRDSVGRPIVPADFTLGLFKSGQDHTSLARTILKGVPGTPMIGYESMLLQKRSDGSLDATDVWALTAYIESLADSDAPAPGAASGSEIQICDAIDPAMITAPAHPAWLGVPAATIRLIPLWRRDQQPTTVQVRAARLNGQVALCLDWRDPQMDLVKDQNRFSDAVAVMFAQGSQVPALPMGVRMKKHEPEAPVNVWFWQSHRHQAYTHGTSLWRTFPLMPETPESIASSLAQSNPILPEYRTASDAGNIHASPQLTNHAALEANAIGFGTLSLQEVESQHVQATAVWANGVWRVLLIRGRQPHSDDDIDLNRERIPVAFAVWDGASGDRAGKKQVSGWHWLVTKTNDDMIAAKDGSHR